MEVIDPLGHHELLVLVVQLSVLLAVARTLGEGFAALGQPSVVGELLAGVVLGPSLLGLVAPDVYGALFAVSESQFHLLEAIAWLGLVMLLVVTGLETDVGLVRREGRTALLVSLGGIVVPFTTGFALGWVLPVAFVAAPEQRLVFGLFVATAMSISAIPVIATVLLELGVVRRDFGQLILAAGMVDDTIGWILLATVAGLARTGGVDVPSILLTIAAVLAFLALSFTVGRRLVAGTIRWVDDAVGGDAALLSTLMIVALAGGAITQSIGLEAILGAFVVGVLVGQVKRFDFGARHSFEAVTLSIFAPLFFALAGLRMDVAALAEPTVFGVGLVFLAVACVGKFGGIVLISGPAGLSRWEAVTIGGGMNARGAMEIVVATVGLGLGILTTNTYSIIVAVAIATSLMAPAIMRWSIPKIEMGEAERTRLERERDARTSFLATLTRVLFPTRGGVDTRFAARLLGPVCRRAGADLDLLWVEPTDPEADETRLRRWVRRVARRWRRERSRPTAQDATVAARDRTFDRVEASLGTWDGRTRRLVRAGADVPGAILAQARDGYDLVVVGERVLGGDPEEPLYSDAIDRLVRETPCPAVIVSAGDRGQSGDALAEPIRRVLLPTVGTRSSRHAAEVAFALARAENALVEVAHVVAAPRPAERFAGRPDLSGEVEVGNRIVDREAAFGRRLGAKVVTTVTVAESPGAALVDLAAESGADVIVMGTNPRPVSRRAFFGPNVEYVVTNAPCPVAVLSSV